VRDGGRTGGDDHVARHERCEVFVRHSGHLREHQDSALGAADSAGGRQGPQRLLGSLLLEGHWISSFWQGTSRVASR
jgi:hypothetical protein